VWRAGVLKSNAENVAMVVNDLINTQIQWDRDTCSNNICKAKYGEVRGKKELIQPNLQNRTQRQKIEHDVNQILVWECTTMCSV